MIKLCLLPTNTAIIVDRTPKIYNNEPIVFAYDNIPENVTLKVVYTKATGEQLYKSIQDGKSEAPFDWLSGEVEIKVYTEDGEYQYKCEPIKVQKITNDKICIYPSENNYMSKITILETTYARLSERVSDLAKKLKNFEDRLTDLLDGYDID